LALEGGASAVYTLGRFGRAVGMILPPSLEFPNGHKVMFKDSEGRNFARFGCQADQQFALPKGDTVAMKTKIIETNKRAGVKPEFFACDRTGHGAGIADLIRDEWSAAIHDVNYSNGPSETKMMLEDSKTCKEDYDRLACELWFGLRAWGEFGYLLIHPSMNLEKLSIQITQRKFKSMGAKKKVESKKDYVSRGHESPDEGDSLTLFVFAARKGSGSVLSMKGGADIPDGADPDDWYEALPMRGGSYVDSSNRTDFLDTRDIDREQPIL
jgi:hypothetical protein